MGSPITDSRNNIAKPRIDLNYLKESPDSSNASKRCYTWGNNSTAASYTPSLTYSYNSSGKPITITRSSTGKYSVRCEGIGGDGKAGGHVQVSAYGFDTHYCKVRYWSSFGKDFVAKRRLLFRGWCTKGCPIYHFGGRAHEIMNEE